MFIAQLKQYQTLLVFISVLFLLPVKFSLAAQSQIDGIRVWPAPENSRIVFDLNNVPNYKYISVSNPNRLVLDFKNSKNIVTLTNIAAHDKRIEKIRTSTAKKKADTRIVIELADKYNLNVFTLAPAGQYGNRLVVDLFDTEKNKVKSVPTYIAAPTEKRDIVIGIDAGHGGEDPGSIGPRGTYEKRVTLAIAKKLQKQINQEKGMKALLTRTGDYYITVGDRSEIARKKSVDFLVSIHADAYTTSKPHGASVWIVSNRRVESELAKWLNNRAKNSELLGGGGDVIKNTKDDNLAITLADMNKEYSLDTSLGVANKLVKELKKITKLHKSTPQSGNFGVLKSSDIPSVLVETGFISNHQEERNLTSSAHQLKLANAIRDGIKKYFIENPLTNTYFASISFRKHKVSSGESLSLLAKRYNVSIGSLKSANNLRSNMVRIGQTLKIPRAE